MNANRVNVTGGNCDLAIRALANAWKLLAHSDEELGIDAEFTRPGIEDLLNKLKDNISNIPDQNYYIFNWDGSFDDEEEEDEEEEVEQVDVNDLEDEEEEDSEDSEEDDDDDYDDEDEDDDFDFDELEEDEDSEIPKELLEKAMDAYNKIVVNIPDDSDSD